MRSQSEKGIVGVMAIIGLLAGAMTAGAATKTWTGAISTNWNDGGNWSGGLPGNGDDVIVTNTTTKPWMAAGTYPASGSFALFSVSNGATITCLGDTGVVNVASGGTVGANHGIGVSIFCTNATINGVLDANARGFSPSLRGPGFGGSTGSHGGRGGQDAPGPTYGSLKQPTALGSTGWGGTGGGAIRLAVTNTLEVNGTITANGIANGSGGGAGGSVWLASSNFTGTGVVQAIGLGTVGGNDRGPGGGRVAIEYTNSTFSGTISVAGGQQGTAGYYGDGEPGTLWEPGRALLFPASGALTVNMDCQYYFPDTNTLYVWDLTVSNAWFEVHGGRVAVSNLTLTNGAFRWDRYAAGQEGMSDMTNLTVSGNVAMRSSGSGYSTLWLTAGTNVWQEFQVGTNGTVIALGDTNVINEVSGGLTGSKHGMGVTIVCTNAMVDGIIMADGKGFPTAVGPGYVSGQGGAYGGHAGDGYGTVYGNLQQPTALGSGGRVSGGGGAIAILAASNLTVNGTISADGVLGGTGAGAAGSIWLRAETFAGSGTVRAAGGGTGGTDPRSGSGGRISLEHTNSTFSGIITAPGGVGGALTSFAGKAQPGTLWEPARNFPVEGVVLVNGSYQYFFPDSVVTHRWDLVVTGAWFEVHGGSMELNSLTLTNGLFRFDAYAAGLEGKLDMTNFTLRGDVTLDVLAGQNSTLWLTAGSYVFDDLRVVTNCYIVPMGDTNIINEASGGTSGVRHGSGVVVRCASAVINGTVAGAGRGFPVKYGPGSAGTQGNATSGSYGGRSGDADKTYGRIAWPTALGSGGYSAAGGGAFKLRTDGTLALNGMIDMRGIYGGSGGGSGGSIWLIAGTLSGGGSILASGADSGEVRGGGGGRIALEYGPASTFTGAVAVSCGTTGSTTGSLFRCQSVSPGASDDAGAGGASLDTVFSTNSFTNGIIVTRTITEWKTWGTPTFTWTDRSMDAGSNQVNNTATYRMSGLPPRKRFSIIDNSVPMFGGARTNSGIQGVLQFQVSLDDAHTIQVQGVALGSVFVSR